MFQFPSSGKGRSKKFRDLITLKLLRTRFNSLQAGRGVQSEVCCLAGWLLCLFQFPSSGKGRSKVLINMDGLTPDEFQFPSSGKGRSKTQNVEFFCQIKQGFNSLQAGRGVQSLSYRISERWQYSQLFQFPSSGKGRSKFTQNVVFCQIKQEFQFPSSGKGRSKPGYVAKSAHYKGFNSLQAGRGVQRSLAETSPKSLRLCFNSLQAGRGVQSSNA